MQRIARVLVVLALAAAPGMARAETMLTHPSLANHAPGPDFHIGTADDVVSSSPLGPNMSGPNVRGAASYLLLKTDGSQPTDGNDYDYIIFFDGNLDLTPNAGSSSSTVAVLDITGGLLQTTPEFTPGRTGGTLGSLSGMVSFYVNNSSALAVISGMFSDPMFMTSIMSQQATAGPGKAVVVMRPMFGGSGNAYLDTTLTPLFPADAGEAALIEFTGTVSGVMDCCSNFAMRGVFALTGTEGSPGATTTTTLPGGGGCTTVTSCGTNLDGTLPSTSSTDKKVKKTAVKLGKLATTAKAKLGAAATATGKKQTKLYKMARTLLNKLLAKATAANTKGRLGVDLAPIQAAVNALLALIPSP